MKAYQDFTALINKTETMQQILKSLEEEPARLLGRICQEYEKTRLPVPDHHLHPSGYTGEVALRALLSAGLIGSEAGGRSALYHYQPTEKGLEQYKNLTESGFYQK